MTEMENLYEIIDKQDSELCSINILQRLAERIALDIWQEENSEEMEEKKKEELWMLLGSIQKQTSAVRDQLNGLLKKIDGGK